MRRTPITEEALAALVRGLNHPSPRVRWWCVQILDHATDPRAITAVSALLDDDVPRVRRVAAHALGCVACKPEWDGALPAGITTKLASIAAADPNPEGPQRSDLRTLAARAHIAADPRPSVPVCSGLVLVIFGALAIGLVLVGGVLMARLLTMAAERSDVWKRYGWPDDEGGEHTRRKDS
jgi:HEAT repeats